MEGTQDDATRIRQNMRDTLEFIPVPQLQHVAASMSATLRGGALSGGAPAVTRAEPTMGEGMQVDPAGQTAGSTGDPALTPEQQMAALQALNARLLSQMQGMRQTAERVAVENDDLRADVHRLNEQNQQLTQGEEPRSVHEHPTHAGNTSENPAHDANVASNQQDVSAPTRHVRWSDDVATAHGDAGVQCYDSRA